MKGARLHRLPFDGKPTKDTNDPSINAHELKAILLLFQAWAMTRHRDRIVVHTNSPTVCSHLVDFMLRLPENTQIQEIFLIVAKGDFFIEPRWVEGE